MPLRSAALLLTTLATAAQAEVIADFAPFLHDTAQPEILTLDGTIDGRTPNKFQQAMERFDGITTLRLASYGGSVYDALPLAYYVRTVGLKTDIPNGKDCASACSYLFFAGVGRSADGRLGVHAIAMPSNDLKAGQRALGQIFAAFEDFGVPPTVHTRMMATPAERMYWFEPDEMTALGLIGQIGAPRSDPDLLASLRSQLELEATIPDWTGPPAEITPAQITTIDRQRQTVAAYPADIGARDTLASYEAALGNYRAAHLQKTYVIEQRGARATVTDLTMLAYYLIAATGGQVSAEAEVALRRALGGDPTDGIALYYLGLMYAQNNRTDTGFAIWRDLLARSQATDPWFEPVRSQIERVAEEAGVLYTLPPVPAPAPTPPVPATPPPPPTAPAVTGREDCGFTTNGDYVCGVPGISGGPRLPTGPAAPEASTPSGTTPGGYGAPSGLAVFAWGLYTQTVGFGALTGQLTRPNGTPYTIRLYAEDEFLKVAYPELGCGGFWELMGNSGSAEFAETLTYGQAACQSGASITATTGGAWSVTISSPAGGGGAASATLGGG